MSARRRRVVGVAFTPLREVRWLRDLVSPAPRTAADVHTLGDLIAALWTGLAPRYGEETASVIIALLVEAPCLDA